MKGWPCSDIYKFRQNAAGMKIFNEAERDGDTFTVRKMLSTAGAQSLINYQDASGSTPLYCAAYNRHAFVTKRHKASQRSSQSVTKRHARIATLIRNTKQKCAKDVLLQASPEKIKKQQEDADRPMRQLLEEDEKAGQGGHA